MHIIASLSLAFCELYQQPHPTPPCPSDLVPVPHLPPLHLPRCTTGCVPWWESAMQDLFPLKARRNEGDPSAASPPAPVSGPPHVPTTSSRFTVPKLDIGKAISESPRISRAAICLSRNPVVGGPRRLLRLQPPPPMLRRRTSVPA